jgi:chromosome segregation ATPase
MAVCLGCLAAMFIFRQLDKKNRSIEKVKKFTDKVFSDFDTYFTEKSRDMQNSGAELATAQSEAVAAIKRLEKIKQETEEHLAGLDQTNSAVLEIQDRINKFDGIIKDVIEMTGTAEENMLRLQNESRFLDKTAKRIQTQKEMLESIEEKIPAITAEFDKTNAGHLQEQSDSLRAYLENTIEELKNGTEDAIHKNSELLAVIQSTYETAFSSASEKAGEIEAEAFRRMHEETDAEVKSCNEALNAEIEKFKQDIKELLENHKESTLSTADSLKKGLSGRLDKLEQRVESAVQKAEQKTEAVINGAEAKLNDAIAGVE